MAEKKKRQKLPDDVPPSRDAESEYRTGADYPVEPDDGLTDPGTAPSVAVSRGSFNLSEDNIDALEPDRDHTRARAELPSRPVAPAIEDEGATSAGAPVKFEVVAGPDTGVTKKMVGVRMSVGRDDSSDWVLTDEAVSRRHVEFVRSDEGVVATDLGSGNGTKVNGAKITDKKLTHGDEIVLGRTKLKFVDEMALLEQLRAEVEAKKANPDASDSNAPVDGEGEEDGGEGAEVGDEAAEAPPSPPPTAIDLYRAQPRPVRYAITGVVTLVFCALVLGVVKIVNQPRGKEAFKEQAVHELSLAKAEAANKRFTAARGHVVKAEQLYPGIDAEGVEEAINAEIKAEADLEKVKAAIAQGDVKRARTLFDTIPTGRFASVDDRQVVKGVLERAEVEAAVNEFDEAVAVGELAKAEALIPALPEAMRVRATADLKQAKLNAEKAEREERKHAQQQQEGERKRSQVQKEVQVAEALATVQRKFVSSDFAGAARECDRVVEDHPGDRAIADLAHQRQKQLLDFSKSYDEGRKKFAQGALASAMKPLGRALATYREMHFVAPFGAELEQDYVTSSVAFGREALGRNDLAGAVTAFKEALRYDPAQPKAKAGMNELAERAKDVFKEGSDLKKTNLPKALEKFRLVMALTSPDSELHSRAKGIVENVSP